MYWHSAPFSPSLFCVPLAPPFLDIALVVSPIHPHPYTHNGELVGQWKEWFSIAVTTCGMTARAVCIREQYFNRLSRSSRMLPIATQTRLRRRLLQIRVFSFGPSPGHEGYLSMAVLWNEQNNKVEAIMSSDQMQDLGVVYVSERVVCNTFISTGRC